MAKLGFSNGKKPILKFRRLEIIIGVHGKGGRSNKMKSSDGSSKREVAEA
jgi:hypothetical protein